MEFDDILKRRTIRFFRQEPVPEAEIRYMLDAACLAASGGNRQPLRYLAIRRPELVKAVFDHTRYAALVKPRRSPEWGRNAPTAFVAICAPENAAVDAGAAVQSLAVAAWNHGIGCCWIGAFDHAEVNALLGNPEPPVLYLAALGYPAESPVAERIPADASTAYYLDERDTLHVPKYTAEAVTTYLD